MVETKLKISGLDCVECARGLEQSIANLPRVESANLQFMDGTLTVNGAVNQKDLRKMVKRFGYRVVEETSDEAAPADSANALLGFWDYLMQRVETRLALIAGAMVVLSLGFGILRFPNWVVISLQMSALVLAGWPIARSGIVNLWVNHTFNINFLMTLAGIGAVVIGEYAEAASLILLFNIAEALEGYSTARARGELAQLTDLAATHAVRLDGSEELVVPVESLSVGDRILVRPGDRIPIDGKILEGQSDINQAPITGESIPVWKDAGDQVFSGSINGTGRLILAVTRLVADSTLQRIIDLVTKAQSRQSRSQKFIDRFARYYTPAMVLLALLIAVIPPLFFGGPFFNTADGTRGWLHRALVMLVISCPCALVISTPVTMAASLARAARKGVLFKGGIFIESLSKMSVFAFDKTGTLTKGEPSVQACRDLSCRKDGGCEACDDMIALAYALERHSAHPLAQAIKAEAEWRGVMDRYPAAKNLVTRQGLGLEGRIKGRTMTIGSLRLFEAEHEIPPVVHDWVDQAEGKGRTAMLLCDGEKVRGFIAVADTPREVSREVIHALNEMGKHTVMLTGDNDTVAAAIGEMIGLDDRRAGLMPGDKQAAIRELQDQFGSVAMVGDGINDAPALASANLGIAMGGSGSAQAMETADVVLMADNLRQLPFALKLSAFANRLIRQNILFSLGSKLLVAGIALFGYTPLWLAVLADMGVSLLVTLNGLRALRFRD